MIENGVYLDVISNKICMHISKELNTFRMPKSVNVFC